MSSSKFAKHIILIAIAIVVLFAAWGCSKPVKGVSTLYPARLSDKDNWSLADLNGNIVVDKQYKDMPSMETEGMVFVKNKNGKYEYFTTDAKPKKVGSEYWEASVFSEGLAAVVAGTAENKYIQYIDKAGKPKISIKKLDGKQIVRASRFNEGLAYVATDDNMYGFIDTTGKLVIKCKFKAADIFTDGLARVSDKDGDNIEWKTGFINKTGKVVIPLKTDVQYGRFSEGLCWFTDTSKETTSTGVINKAGKVVIKATDDFQSIGQFTKGIATFSDGEAMGLINTTGKKVVRPKYTQLIQLPGGVLVGDEEGMGVINTRGKEIVPVDDKYQTLIPLGKGKYLVRESKKWIFINSKGKLVNKNEFDDFDPRGLLGYEYAEDSVRFTSASILEPEFGDYGDYETGAPAAEPAPPEPAQR